MLTIEIVCLEFGQYGEKKLKRTEYIFRLSETRRIKEHKGHRCLLTKNKLKAHAQTYPHVFGHLHINNKSFMEKFDATLKV